MVWRRQHILPLVGIIVHQLDMVKHNTRQTVCDMMWHTVRWQLARHNTNWTTIALDSKIKPSFKQVHEMDRRPESQLQICFVATMVLGS